MLWGALVSRLSYLKGRRPIPPPATVTDIRVTWPTMRFVRDGGGFERILLAVSLEDLGMRLHVLDRFEPCPREVCLRFRLGLHEVVIRRVADPEKISRGKIC